MSVHRIVYVSMAAPDIDQATLDAILETARTKNKSRGITGFLLMLDGHFMQLLEGLPEAVQLAYQEICADSRHSNPVIVLQTEGKHRCFPEWRMGCHIAQAEERRNTWSDGSASRVAGVLPGSVTADVRSLFLGFRGTPGVEIGVQ